jgi:Mor family transcriptional regulator
MKDVTLGMLPPEQQGLAAVIGMTAYLKLVNICGGGPPLYIPCLAELRRNQRNSRIKQAFTGRNYMELAKEFELTERTIRRVVGKPETG